MILNNKIKLYVLPKYFSKIPKKQFLCPTKKNHLAWCRIYNLFKAYTIMYHTISLNPPGKNLRRFLSHFMRSKVKILSTIFLTDTEIMNNLFTKKKICYLQCLSPIFFFLIHFTCRTFFVDVFSNNCRHHHHLHLCSGQFSFF